ELYETEFESAPPSEFWPDAAPSAARLRWIDRRHCWIFSKDLARRLAFFFIPVTIIALILSSSHGEAGQHPGAHDGTLAGLIVTLLIWASPFWLTAAFGSTDCWKTSGDCNGCGCGGCGAACGGCGGCG